MAWLLLYPDTYEIGLPNQGLQILYEILNERPDALAERAYAPWVDMEAAMRAAGVPLFSVEQHLPAAAFDVLAFNLSAELVYTNLVNMLDLAGLPLHGCDRGGNDALVVAGGHCVYNPEPLADFVDAFVLGDGEEVVGEINAVMADWLARLRRDSETAPALLRRWPHWTACTCPRSTPASYDDGRLVSTLPVERRRAYRGDEADHQRPGRLALSFAAPRAADGGGPRSPQCRGVPRLHAGLPFLPGRHDHTARA